MYFEEGAGEDDLGRTDGRNREPEIKRHAIGRRRICLLLHYALKIVVAAMNHQMRCECHLYFLLIFFVVGSSNQLQKKT